jgi:Putative prokaryotic signal transducing protein
MSLVELARFPSGYEAELIRGRLESAGVHAVCFDAGMNIAESVGLMIPVRIMVLDEDLAEAQALLSEFENPFA